MTDQSLQIELDGALQYVHRSGRGRPALLLHGVPDSADLWHPLVARIGQDFRCYAPDLPGFRRSALPRSFTFSLEGYAHYVAQLVQALEINEPLTLVAHDWGGIMGLAWACRNPGNVARIVVADTVFSHLYRWHAWARVWRTPLLGEASMLLMNRWLFRAAMRRGSRRLDRARIDAMYAAMCERYAMRFTVLKLYRSLPPRDFLPWESRLQALAAEVPITVLHGAGDPYIPSSMARLMHTPDVRVVRGVGHWLPVEATEELAAAVLIEQLA